MFVEMYGKQFTLEELKLADVKTMETLHQLFGDSLNGGKTDEEVEDGDDSKKGKITPEEARDNLLTWIKKSFAKWVYHLEIKQIDNYQDFELIGGMH